MKTALFCTAWLDGFDCNNESYLERFKKYLAYYQAIQNELGWDEIYLVENGSQKTTIEPFYQIPNLRIFQYEQNLARAGIFDYPYCWRWLFHGRKLIEEGYTKIIMIDTDSFVLTKRLAEYIKRLEKGWTALWCARYQFPETNCAVLCQDAFNHFLDFTSGSFLRYNGKVMERTIPFTHIAYGMNTDRYGEDDVPQNNFMDFYSQARLGRHLSFI